MPKKLILDFEKSAEELIQMLLKIEDQDLTDEERETVRRNYDRLSVHGSISIDSLSN